MRLVGRTCCVALLAQTGKFIEHGGSLDGPAFQIAHQVYQAYSVQVTGREMLNFAAFKQFEEKSCETLIMLAA